MKVLVADGQRVAFAPTAIFLRINGLRLRVSATEGESFLIGKVIEGRAEHPKIAARIERHLALRRSTV